MLCAMPGEWYRSVLSQASYAVGMLSNNESCKHNVHQMSPLLKKKEKVK
jgi:hypothetical protein